MCIRDRACRLQNRPRGQHGANAGENAEDDRNLRRDSRRVTPTAHAQPRESGEKQDEDARSEERPCAEPREENEGVARRQGRSESDRDGLDLSLIHI